MKTALSNGLRPMARDRQAHPGPRTGVRGFAFAHHLPYDFQQASRYYRSMVRSTDLEVVGRTRISLRHPLVVPNRADPTSWRNLRFDKVA